MRLVEGEPLEENGPENRHFTVHQYIDPDLHNAGMA